MSKPCTDPVVLFVAPTEPCPKCRVRAWYSTSMFHHASADVWNAHSTCLTCQSVYSWPINPDVPVEYQPCNLMKHLA